MICRDIKDLSIAAEALSRIPHISNTACKVEQLLDRKVQQLKNEMDGLSIKPPPISSKNADDPF